MDIINTEQENAVKNNDTITLQERIKYWQCSYCQSIREDGNDHSIQTYKNMLMRGKSPYTKDEIGEYKLFHVKGYSAGSLSNDHNIIT